MNPAPASTVTLPPTDSRSDDPRIAAVQEGIIAHSAWVTPLRQQIARVIVGQYHLIDSLLIALTNSRSWLLC